MFIACFVSLCDFKYDSAVEQCSTILQQIVQFPPDIAPEYEVFIRGGNLQCCIICIHTLKVMSGKKYNKAFKSDSQRLAVSLRSSIAKRRSHLNAALCARRQNEQSVLIRLGRHANDRFPRSNRENV
ncbi:hypothetical protein AL550_013685 [Vibrio parahaemolyticus]|nr:hypothetical protein AL550_013685 [Vibrio parahaemolyticus]